MFMSGRFARRPGQSGRGKTAAVPDGGEAMRLGSICSSVRAGMLSAAIGVIGFALPAGAATVLVDFGSNATTTTAPDALGRTWNNVDQNNDVSGSPFTLNSTLGTDSGYRLTVSNPAGVTNAV